MMRVSAALAVVVPLIFVLVKIVSMHVLLLLVAVAAVYALFASHPMVAGALRGMGAVAAGLIAGTGLKLAAALRKHPLGPWLCIALAALTFAGMALLRWPLAWVLPALGGVACVLTWRKIAP